MPIAIAAPKPNDKYASCFAACASLAGTGGPPGLRIAKEMKLPQMITTIPAITASKERRECVFALMGHLQLPSKKATRTERYRFLLVLHDRARQKARLETVHADFRHGRSRAELS